MKYKVIDFVNEQVTTFKHKRPAKKYALSIYPVLSYKNKSYIIKREKTLYNYKVRCNILYVEDSSSYEQEIWIQAESVEDAYNRCIDLSSDKIIIFPIEGKLWENEK